jgi:hypothetical protein
VGDRGAAPKLRHIYLPLFHNDPAVIVINPKSFAEGKISGINFDDLSMGSRRPRKPAGARHGVLLHRRPILDLNRMVNMNDVSRFLVVYNVAARR